MRTARLLAGLFLLFLTLPGVYGLVWRFRVGMMGTNLTNGAISDRGSRSTPFSWTCRQVNSSSHRLCTASASVGCSASGNWPFFSLFFAY